MRLYSTLSIGVLCLAFGPACSKSSEDTEPDTETVTETESDTDTDTDSDTDTDTDTDTDSDTDTDTDSDTDTGTAPTGECDHFSQDRNPYFGDLHVHTSYSFDSYTLGNYASGPEEAYRFAKGEEMPIPPFESDGSSKGERTARLRAPLDFAAVTDHSEFLAETLYCSTPPRRASPAGWVT